MFRGSNKKRCVFVVEEKKLKPNYKQIFCFSGHQQQKKEEKKEVVCVPVKPKDDQKKVIPSVCEDEYIGFNPLLSHITDEKKIIYIQGSTGSGKLFSVKNYALKKGLAFVRADDENDWFSLFFTSSKKSAILITNVDEFEKEKVKLLKKFVQKVKNDKCQNLLFLTGNFDYNKEILFLSEFLYKFPDPTPELMTKILHARLQLPQSEERQRIYKDLVFSSGADIRYMLNQSCFHRSNGKKDERPNIFEQASKIFNKTFGEEESFDSFFMFSVIFESYMDNEQYEDMAEILSDFDLIKNDENIAFICKKTKKRPIITIPKSRPIFSNISFVNLKRKYRIDEILLIYQKSLVEATKDFNKAKSEFSQLLQLYINSFFETKKRCRQKV